MATYALNESIRRELEFPGMDDFIAQAKAGDIVVPDLEEDPDISLIRFWFGQFLKWARQEHVSADQAITLAVKFLRTRIFKKFEMVSPYKEELKQFLHRYRLDAGKAITWFSYKELKTATKGFSSDSIIGVGVVNTVYKGTLHDGRLTVAVKKYNEVRKTTLNEVCREVRIQRNLPRSKTLCAMLGFCLNEQSPLLVYEYVPYGNLEQHLQGENPGQYPFNTRLLWSARLEIAIHVAIAIKKLHQQGVYHLDVKSANILIEDPAVGSAKLADFGIALEIPKGSGGRLPTKLKGSRGYIDPFQEQHSLVTNKADVYSFGVVLMELVTAKKAWDLKSSAELLPKLVEKKYGNGELFEIVDESVWTPCPMCNCVCEHCSKLAIKAVIELAIRCCSSNPNARPTVKEVVELLLGIRQDMQQPH